MLNKMCKLKNRKKKNIIKQNVKKQEYKLIFHGLIIKISQYKQYKQLKH